MENPIKMDDLGGVEKPTMFGKTSTKTHESLYFWRSTPQNKAFSNQNKGHLGSRYTYTTWKSQDVSLLKPWGSTISWGLAAPEPSSRRGNFGKFPAAEQVVFVEQPFWKGPPFFLGCENGNLFLKVVWDVAKKNFCDFLYSLTDFGMRVSCL